MGIEIFVMAFALASAVCGLLGPVVIWATWTSVSRTRFLRELASADEVRDVRPLIGTDAAAPVRMTAEVGRRKLQLSAVVRGNAKLWHVHVARDPNLPGFALVSPCWTAASAAARDLPRQEEWGLGSFRLYCVDVSLGDVSSLLERSLVSATFDAQMRSHQPLRQLVADDTSYFFEIVREDLKSGEALSVVRRVLRLVHALEGRTANPALMPPQLPAGNSGTTDSGAPVGVSVGALTS